MESLYDFRLYDFIEKVVANSVVLTEGADLLEPHNSYKVFDLENAVLKSKFIGGARYNHFEIFVKNPEIKLDNYDLKDISLKNGDYTMMLSFTGSSITVAMRDVGTGEIEQKTLITLKSDGTCEFLKLNDGTEMEAKSVSVDDIISALEAGDYSAFVTCNFGKKSGKNMKN